MKRWLSGLLAALTLFTLTSCAAPSPSLSPAPPEQLIELPGEENTSTPEATETPEAPPTPAASPSEEALPSPEAPSGDTLPDGLVSGESRSDIPERVEPAPLPEDGTYTTKEDVALYIHTYGRLPDNFITKKEAQNLGWPGGDLEPYAPGKCIGGSRFGNYEGLLPEGRSYTECDIDTLGAKSRGAKRIVFSDDGLIYYTEDHYESFELLYGDEGDG